MKKEWTYIRIEKKVKTRLEELKKYTNLSYSAFISKYLPTQNGMWKEDLYNNFKTLEEQYPDKKTILEYMRLIILYSKELPEDLMRECDEEMRMQLNELSHKAFGFKKEVKKGKKDVKHDVSKKDVKHDVKHKTPYREKHNPDPKGNHAVTDYDDKDRKERAVTEALTEILQDDPDFLEREDLDPIFIILSKLGEKGIDVGKETIVNVLESERKRYGGGRCS